MSKRKKPASQKGPKEPAIVLVSYFPLLRGQAGRTFDFQKERDALQRITKQLEATPSARASACLWMLDEDQRPLPVLALEQAEAIAAHLVECAENDPAKWFQVYLREKDGKYALVLFPEIRQSLSRFRFAHLLEGGDPVTSGQVQVLTHPLHFVSGGGTAYAAIRDRIGPTLKVGLVEVTRLDLTNPFGLDPALIQELGTFSVGDPDQLGLSQYLEGLLDDATEPPAYPSRLNPAARDQLQKRPNQA